MKLPFKLPSIKLPKFGKKKTEDDEDDDDDFDPSDFEGDSDASLGEEAESPAVEGDDSGADDEVVDSPPDEADEAGAEGEKDDGGDGAGELPPADDDAGEQLEDIDFGDDDDEEGKGGLKSKRKLIIIGGGATAGLLLVGGLSWFFLAGDSPEDKAEAGKKSDIPLVVMDIAPKRKAADGLSLNAIVAGAKGPGAGVIVPVVSQAAFASLTAPAVAGPPLVDGNDPALSEESPQGRLPIIAEDGRMAWQVYAKPFKNQSSNPRVAIVVSGLGMSEAATIAAIELLPGNVTLAFDPYAPGLLDWLARARQAGHEAMIMVPLEPAAFPVEDPGPQGLMTTNAPEENRLRLEFILSRSTGYVGVMSVMGSRFKSSDEHMRWFLDEIKLRGLMYLEGGIDQDSLGPKLATEIGLPRALTNIVIDSIPTSGAIDEQLAELENILNGQPVAVAIAEAYPSSIKRLAVWTAGLEAKNLVLAPLSSLADKQFLR